MKTFAGSCLLILITFAAYCQKEVRTFYDPQKRKPQENYFVSNADNSVYIWKYKPFYENGNLIVEG